MNLPLLTLEVRVEADIVLARQRARQVAGLLGFAALDQTRIATAVSEIVRNAHAYAGGGRVEFAIDGASPRGLCVRVRQRGAGIEDLQSILDERYTSPTGLGLGIVGARRLMDRFEIESSAGATSVVMTKVLPHRASTLSGQDVARLSADLAQQKPQGLLDELQLQNQELSRALQELKDRQAELTQLHSRELDETNRGVVALYSELDDTANSLRRISDLKTRFLSNMSHEFRSPLNTILSMSGFLLDGSSGELSPEQEKEIGFIRKAAEGLSALVNDLLDLARVEAGKAVVRPSSFQVADLFDGLYATTRPLLVLGRVALIVEIAPGIASVVTDEGKLTQILRNFLSNAVKFTEVGEIRLSATPGPDDTVIFSVSDTGIGIRPEDESRIFEEFGQVEGPIQGRVKGTGLGLPLSRKLAELIGGRVALRSEPGAGSTFSLAIPRVYIPTEQTNLSMGAIERLDERRCPVLVVEDDPATLGTYEHFLEGSGFQVIPATTLDEARRVLGLVRPVAVLLDIVLDAESGWTLLTEMKGRPSTRDIPIFVMTVVDGRERATMLEADGFSLKPIDRGWLLDRLDAIGRGHAVEKILIIDDQEDDRRLLKKLLFAQRPFDILEAPDGVQGISLARAARPNVVFLDLILPDMTGFQVMERLKSDVSTGDIPIIINTAQIPSDEERQRLLATTSALLTKASGVTPEALKAILDALTRAGLSPIPNGPEV